VVVKVVIQNKGNIEAIGVTPQLPPSNDLILVGSLNQPVSLKPGEEQEIAFALKPSADSSPEKTVVLSFSSATGAQIAKKITVPTMGSFGLFGLSWGAIALLVLLILLVAFVVTRRKKE
jgi:hypothetical protein